MENQHEFTPKRLYVSRLKARRVVNSEGWMRMEPYPPYEPTGNDFIDRLAGVLAKTQNFRVSHIVQLMGLEKTLLASLLLHYSGMKLRPFLLAYRMLVAQELLQCTDVDLHEVARRCGIGSYPAFSRLFRREVGASPREYRYQKRPTNYKDLYQW